MLCGVPHWEIIGYTWQGEVYCDDPHHAIPSDAQPVLAGDEMPLSACAECGFPVGGTQDEQEAAIAEWYERVRD